MKCLLKYLEKLSGSPRGLSGRCAEEAVNGVTLNHGILIALAKNLVVQPDPGNGHFLNDRYDSDKLVVTSRLLVPCECLNNGKIRSPFFDF